MTAPSLVRLEGHVPSGLRISIVRIVFSASSRSCKHLSKSEIGLTPFVLEGDGGGGGVGILDDDAKLLIEDVVLLNKLLLVAEVELETELDSV